MVFQQILLEKACFISKMPGLTMVRPASSDLWKAPLDETEPAKKAKDLLEKAPYKQLTPSDYCVVHDYLIASLEMQHRQHPGPLETVIMEDYNNAEEDPVSGTTTIYALDHKTSTSGPAPIFMFKDPGCIVSHQKW